MAEIQTIIQLRNDTANAWETEAGKATPLMPGEAAAVFTKNGKVKLMIGANKENGTFADALQVGGEDAQVFQSEILKAEDLVDENGGAKDDDNIIVELTTGAEVHAGDMAIIKKYINGVDGAVSYTSYVYELENGWVAMDGNYSAENVFLKDNITLAGEYTQVGNLTKTKNGTATFATAGLSVAEAFKKMLSATLQPKITANPSISVTLANAGAKEVGTIFSPSYTTGFEDGSYTYASTTGATLDGTYTVTTSGYATTRANDASFTDNKGKDEESNTGASGTFTSFVVDEDTSYKLSASAKHTAGNVAKDNLGGDSSPVIQIVAGTKTANSSAVTGYRAKFFGWYNSKALDPTALTSADIRKLAVTGTVGTTERPLTAIPSGDKAVTTTKMQQMFFAAPKGTYTSVSVANDTNGAPQTVKGPVNVKVEGANGFTAVDYDVFYIDNDGAEGGTTVFDITLA